MTIGRPSWTPLCVAAIVTFLGPGAKAGQTYRLKAGETLSAIATRFHVPVRDLEAANHLTDRSVLTIGRAITIPAAPKRLVLRPRLYSPQRICRERVSVRLGPGAGFRRMAVLDIGARAVVTARRDGWAQIALGGGRFGWVRGDMVSGHPAAGAVRSAAAAPPASDAPHHRQRLKPLHAVAESRRRRLARIGVAGPHMARKAHERQHPARLARRSRERRHAERSAELRRTRRAHAMRLAALRHAKRLARHLRNSARTAGIRANGDVIRTALAYRGTPYRWGGASGRGFDCSGFTSYVYRHAGVSLPHSASSQFHYGKHVEHSNLRPGDLVFFETVHRGISHVGMYVGNGKFVHASSRRAGGVRVDSLAAGYYRQRFRGGRRLR
jgi:cell wall-associated NlpC family hydrolase